VLGEVAVGEGWKGWSHGGDRWSAAVGKHGPGEREGGGLSGERYLAAGSLGLGD
jgi:hypothetical protein